MARYDFRENSGLNYEDEDEEKMLYPRIVPLGTIDIKDMAKDLTQATTFTPGEVEGMLLSLTDNIVRYLKEGNNVKLGELGYFSIRLKSRKVKSKSEIRATSVFFDNVNFRASAYLKKELKVIPLVRAKAGFSVSANPSKEECLQLLRDYFDSHSFISRKDYSALTGMLKGKALRSLKELVAEKYLVRHGSATHLVYLKGERL